MVSIVPLQRRQAEARMDLSGTTRGELPIPMNASYGPAAAGSVVVSGAGGHAHAAAHAAAAAHNGQQQMMTPLIPAAAAEVENNAAAAIGIGKKRSAAGAGNGGGAPLAVKYRECLKNHAAAIGGNATDGCGEFMPSGEEGSLEALKCSACGCHRNFHRKDVDDDFALHRRLLLLGPHHSMPRGGPIVPSSGADHYAGYTRSALPPPPPPPHQIVMPLNMIHSSESDEMDTGAGLGVGHGGALLSRSLGHGGGHGGGGSSSSQQKRFRTKFTQEQKARMLAFAEGVGWRLQRADDAAVQRFCQEIGVKRRVLKVWMHNNKHNLATNKLPASPQPEAQAQDQPPMAPAPMNSLPPPPQELAGPSSSSPPTQDDHQLNRLE